MVRLYAYNRVAEIGPIVGGFINYYTNWVCVNQIEPSFANCYLSAMDLLCPTHLVGRNVGSHHIPGARNISSRSVTQKGHQAQKRHGQPGLASANREHEQIGLSDRRMELCETVPASVSRSDVPEFVHPLSHPSGHLVPIFRST
jgi:hypothetical protein